MRISSRALVNRLATYPVLLPLMLIYALAENKNPILDAFYTIRGLPHGWLKGKTRIAFYDSFTIVFPFDEDPSFDDVWLRNVYYPYRPKNDDVVVDIGAHMGFFTLKVAKTVRKVVAVEPDPVNFHFLSLNVRLNRVTEKVILHNCAIGEKESQIYLDRGYYGFGRTKIAEKETGYLTKMTTTDRLIESERLQRLDLIKIDAEGYELQILNHAQRTLEEFHPRLLIAAYHFRHEASMLSDRLLEFGYEVKYYQIPLILSRFRETYLYASHQ